MQAHVKKLQTQVQLQVDGQTVGTGWEEPDCLRTKELIFLVSTHPNIKIKPYESICPQILQYLQYILDTLLIQTENYFKKPPSKHPSLLYRAPPWLTLSPLGLCRSLIFIKTISSDMLPLFQPGQKGLKDRKTNASKYVQTKLTSTGRLPMCCCLSGEKKYFQLSG